MILTTTIGSFPKPSFLPLSDWFKGEKGTDNERPTSVYQEEKKKMGSQYESLVNEASKQSFPIFLHFIFFIFSFIY